MNPRRSTLISGAVAAVVAAVIAATLAEVPGSPNGKAGSDWPLGVWDLSWSNTCTVTFRLKGALWDLKGIVKYPHVQNDHV